MNGETSAGIGAIKGAHFSPPYCWSMGQIADQRGLVRCGVSEAADPFKSCPVGQDEQNKHAEQRGSSSEQYSAAISLIVSQNATAFALGTWCSRLARSDSMSPAVLSRMPSRRTTRRAASSRGMAWPPRLF